MRPIFKESFGEKEICGSCKQCTEPTEKQLQPQNCF